MFSQCFAVSHTGNIVSSVRFLFPQDADYTYATRQGILTKTRACEHLQKFCEHEQASTQLKLLLIDVKIEKSFLIYGLLKITFHAWSNRSKPLQSIRCQTQIYLRSPLKQQYSVATSHAENAAYTWSLLLYFAAAAPARWNNLPADVRTVTSSNSFKKSIKTFS